jgi:hypothetical protein
LKSRISRFAQYRAIVACGSLVGFSEEMIIIIIIIKNIKNQQSNQFPSKIIFEHNDNKITATVKLTRCEFISSIQNMAKILGNSRAIGLIIGSLTTQSHKI